MNEHGFIMFNRTDEAIELLRDPYAFALLALIARRARWRTLLSSDGLEIGEAMLGDCENFGMTRAIYRNRLRRLIRWGQIATRRTNKGTIAKLISSLVFDLNLPANGQLQNHQQDHQRTNAEPSENHQKTNGEPLTNKGRREEGDKEIKKNAAAERKDAALKIAATITDLKDINRLEEFYPSHNLSAEWSFYSKYRDKLGKAKTGETFVEWLEKAQPRIEEPDPCRDVTSREV